MYTIEKDLDKENHSATVTIGCIDKTIGLQGDNWGTISDNVHIDTIVIDFIIRELDTKTEEEFFNHISQIGTYDDLKEKLKGPLFNVHIYINVYHDNVWSIYNDKLFETDISDLLGIGIMFTEQGMQMDGDASMEN